MARKPNTGGWRMRDNPETIKNVVDFVAATNVVAVALAWMPDIAAVLTVLWFAVRLWSGLAEALHKRSVRRRDRARWQIEDS
jgi:hypothetical protein